MVYSGFLRRFAANFIDSMILFIPSLAMGTGAGSVFSSMGFGVVVGLIYYPVFESSVLSATPGKALMGMVVVSEAGERLNFKSAVVRHLCRYLSMITLYIGYLMQVFTAKRQTLHDMLSEAVVIDRPSPDLNYFVVWKEQFKDIIKKF